MESDVFFVLVTLAERETLRVGGLDGAVLERALIWLQGQMDGTGEN